jgi:hypothetical protein
MGWQVTATTVKCQYVGDFATIMVKPDGASKCSYVNRHSQAKDGTKKLRSCKWPNCPLVSDFQKQALAL